QEAVAGVLYDTAATLRDLRIDQFAEVGFEPFVRSFFIGSHQARITDHVGCENCGETPSLTFDATECVPGLSVYSCRQTLSIAIENVGGGYRQRPTSGLGFRRLAVAQPQINVLELLRDGDRRCDSATRSYARDRAISENMVRRTGHDTAPDLQPES